MRGSCLGRAGHIFSCRYFLTPSSSLHWWSRGHWRHRSPCWSWCLDRYWKRILSKFVFQSLTAEESLHSFLNCAALFALSEMHSRKGSNYIHHSTLFCWSRMSSVTLLRISSKLKPDNVFPLLLCTSFMKLMKSELKGESRKTRLLTGNTMAMINIRERCSFHVWFTAVDALKDTNSSNEL